MQIWVQGIKGLVGHTKSNEQRQAGNRKWFKSSSPTQKTRRAEPAEREKLRHILKAYSDLRFPNEGAMVILIIILQGSCRCFALICTAY